MPGLLQKAEQRFTDSGIKEITLKNLMRNLRKIVDNTGVKTFTEKNKEKVMEYVNSIENKGSRKNYLKPITKYLKDEKRKKKLYEFYLNEMKNLENVIQEKINENKFTETEKERYTEWNTIKNIDINNQGSLDRKLYLSFIINDNIFLRLAYFKIKLKNYNEEKDNYIKNGKLFMNDFKNNKGLGRQEFSLSKKTKELINKRGDEEYLFSNHGVQQSGLTKFVKRVFRDTTGKEVNNNLLRKIFINSHDVNNMTNKEIDDVAIKMMTTRTMFLNNYRKVK